MKGCRLKVKMKRQYQYIKKKKKLSEKETKRENGVLITHIETSNVWCTSEMCKVVPPMRIKSYCENWTTKTARNWIDSKNKPKSWMMRRQKKWCTHNRDRLIMICTIHFVFFEFHLTRNTHIQCSFSVLRSLSASCSKKVHSNQIMCCVMP